MVPGRKSIASGPGGDVHRRLQHGAKRRPFGRRLSSSARPCSRRCRIGDVAGEPIQLLDPRPQTAQCGVGAACHVVSSRCLVDRDHEIFARGTRPRGGPRRTGRTGPAACAGPCPRCAAARDPRRPRRKSCAPRAGPRAARRTRRLRRPSTQWRRAGRRARGTARPPPGHLAERRPGPAAAAGSRRRREALLDGVGIERHDAAARARSPRDRPPGAVATRPGSSAVR